MNTYELPVLTVLKRLCIGYVVLVLISACLYWTIPSNAGLGLALMVGPFPFLIAVLGAIALGVALWNEWAAQGGQLGGSGDAGLGAGPGYCRPCFRLHRN